MHKAVALDREVAQLGRVLGLGPRCRRFESCLPDSILKESNDIIRFFFIIYKKKELALFPTLFISQFNITVIPNFDIFLRKRTFVLVYPIY